MYDNIVGNMRRSIMQNYDRKEVRQMAIEKRLYSLFEKQDGKWVQISKLGARKSAAVRIFQCALLNGSFAGKEMRLRIVNKEWNDELQTAIK